jgi:hypothetical protein
MTLWGDGPAAGVGALFDVGPGTGVEFPDFGLESGESNELMSILQNQSPRLALDKKEREERQKARK